MHHCDLVKAPLGTLTLANLWVLTQLWITTLEKQDDLKIKGLTFRRSDISGEMFCGRVPGFRCITKSIHIKSIAWIHFIVLKGCTPYKANSNIRKYSVIVNDQFNLWRVRFRTGKERDHKWMAKKEQEKQEEEKWKQFEEIKLKKN